MHPIRSGLSRRETLRLAGAAGLAGVLTIYPGRRSFASADQEIELRVEPTRITVDGTTTHAISIGGSVPGPTLRWREGQEIVLHVLNRLDEPTSIHWHGLLLDGIMDGSPGFNAFPEIKPGQTYTYRFKLRQAGTYWYHSHSASQEQLGMYGAIVIEPAGREPVRADRDYVVLLSDHISEDPRKILRKLKVSEGYYNYGKRTLIDFFRDIREEGLKATWRDRLDWGQMRMDATDLADVTGYSFLVNGKGPQDNWTALFKPGERVRLRIVNGSAMSIFDVRIPGLPMTVVAADGQNVMPVKVDEFRFGVGETYDVIVRPTEDRAFTFFAEPIDRSGYARATLAPREGMSADMPERRPRTVLTMDDMGAHGGMDHGSMSHGNMDHGSHQGAMDHGSAGHGSMGHGAQTAGTGAAHGGGHAGHSGGTDHAAMGHGTMGHGPGGHGTEAEGGTGTAKGWADAGTPPGAKALSYADLKALTPNTDTRDPTHEIELRLTGIMERYVWTLNGRKFLDADPIRVAYGDRIRLRFVNETMMAHPMHLHGMFMELENGETERRPRKHVILVPPGKTVTALLTADEPGEWPFHCHLLYHMNSGMMTRLIVEPRTASL